MKRPNPSASSSARDGRAVLRDRGLRRVLVGLAAVSIAERAAWLALLVFAYQAGGVGEVGWVAAALLIPAAVLAPVVAVVADWFPRHRILPWGFAISAATLMVTAGTISADAPVWSVYASAAAFSVAMTFPRPAVASVLPRVAGSLDELTAANVGVTMVDSVGRLAGPAAAGVILVAGTPATVLVSMAVVVLFGAVLTVRAVPTFSGVHEHADDPARERARDELMAGVRVIRNDSRARALIAVLVVTSLIAGALDVGAAAIAVELLGRNEQAVGLLMAAFGAGALVGATASIGMVGQRRLTWAIVGSTTARGLAFATVAWSSSLLTTTVLLFVVGVGGSLTGVTGRTMLQGLAPDDTLARIFGVLESLSTAARAFGGVALSGLAVALGLTEALVILGVVSIVVVLARSRTLAAIDADRRPVDPELLALVRSSPIFAPLPLYAIEQILHNMTRQAVSPGERIMALGDEGRNMLLVEEGAVVVSLPDGEKVVRGPGSHLGEIALLRSTTRTADVDAGSSGAVVYWMESDVFLRAVSSVPRSLARAEAEADRRVNRDR